MGLILHFNLNFEYHLMEKIKRRKKDYGYNQTHEIYHVIIPFETLNKVYKSLVRQNLDYCDIIYHTPHAILSLVSDSHNHQDMCLRCWENALFASYAGGNHLRQEEVQVCFFLDVYLSLSELYLSYAMTRYVCQC